MEDGRDVGEGREGFIILQAEGREYNGQWSEIFFVMDMVIFRTIFFELLVFFTFTLFTFHFAY